MDMILPYEKTYDESVGRIPRSISHGAGIRNVETLGRTPQDWQVTHDRATAALQIIHC